MKVSTASVSDCKKMMTVQISAAEVAQAMQLGVHDFLARVGAKPIEAGENLEAALIRRFGETRAAEALTNLVINHMLPMALDEAGLVPACSPIPVKPDVPELGRMYMFMAEVYVCPEMELSSYEPPKAVVKRVRISGRDVDNQLMALAQEFATMEQDPATGEMLPTLPVINDEWVRDVYPDDEVNSAHELRATVRQALEIAAEQDLEQEKVSAAVANMGRRLVGEVPQEIVDIMAADMFASIQEEAIDNGQILEVALRQAGSSLEAFKAELAEDARKTLVEGLVMDAIFRHFNMEVTDEDVETTIQGIAATADASEREAVVEHLRSMGKSSAIMEVARRMKAGQWIAENAIITVA